MGISGGKSEGHSRLIQEALHVRMGEGSDFFAADPRFLPMARCAVATGTGQPGQPLGKRLAQFVSGGIADHQIVAVLLTPVGALVSLQHHHSPVALAGSETHQLELQTLLALPLVLDQAVGDIDMVGQLG